MVADEIADDTPLWQVARQANIARTPSALTGAATHLLLRSKDLLFVDPYFAPDTTRFRQTLSAFLTCACSGQVKRRIEYHLEARATADHFQDECQSRLPALIPVNAEVKFVRWRQRPNGTAFHARYILTDIGGLSFDVGLDQGSDGEETDVSILDVHLYENRWRDYQRDTAAFEFVDEFVVRGTR